MLIISSVSPSLVSLPSNSSELQLSSIPHRKHRLLIGTFYRPPSSTMAISSLSSLLSNLSSSILSNLILVGDFNVNYVSSSSSPLFLELKSLADSYSLSQVISDPTHFSHAGTPSIINPRCACAARVTVVVLCVCVYVCPLIPAASHIGITKERYQRILHNIGIV